MAYSIDWIENEDDFDALAGSWERLVGDGMTPFDTHRWYAAWWRAFGRPGTLRVATAWEDGELAGVFPLHRSRGNGLSALANWHTPIYRPIARDARALEAVTHGALSHRAASVELSNVPLGDAGLAAVQRAAAAAGRRHVAEPQYVSPIVETLGTFDDWRRRTRRQWRTDLERFRRKVRRRATDLSIVEPPGDLAAELSAGFAVEAAGWKGRTGSAVASSLQTERFYRELAAAFDPRGELRLSRIVLDDGWAAFDFCLLHGGRLYLLKTGYDERFRNLSPGLVLRLETIERCFELGLDAHELLGGTTEWKQKFATSERAHTSYRAYRPRPAALSRWVYRSMLRPQLRSAYRRLRPAPR